MNKQKQKLSNVSVRQFSVSSLTHTPAQSKIKIIKLKSKNIISSRRNACKVDREYVGGINQNVYIQKIKRMFASVD